MITAPQVVGDKIGIPARLIELRGRLNRSPKQTTSEAAFNFSSASTSHARISAECQTA
jgi:hypothetical protein